MTQILIFHIFKMTEKRCFFQLSGFLGDVMAEKHTFFRPLTSSLNTTLIFCDMWRSFFYAPSLTQYSRTCPDLSPKFGIGCLLRSTGLIGSIGASICGFNNPLSHNTVKCFCFHRHRYSDVGAVLESFFNNTVVMRAVIAAVARRCSRRIQRAIPWYRSVAEHAVLSDPPCDDVSQM